MDRRRSLVTLLPVGWAVVLAVALLGPALGSGYVLLRDMVWVPDLSLNRTALGLSQALPRAVPSDAVVAVLDEAVPGMVLQKVMLLGALLLAATGAVRLAVGGLVARLVAVSVTVWSPFVVERLGMGHWPMLLAYAAVPWLAVAGRRAAESGRVPAPTYLVLVLGSLSANAGLVSSAVLLATGVRRRTGVTVRLVAACLAANAPWIVAGALHASAAERAGGYDVFALHGDALPAPLAAITLGGVWNADVVPASRTGALAWVGLAFVVVLAVAGARPWARRHARDQQVALVALAVAGFGIALVSWGAPGAVGWLGGHVPGVGLLRDGSRELPLALPLLVGLVAAGAERLVGMAPAVVPRVAAAVVVVLLPVTVMPDAAGGLGGELRAAHYPAEWLAVRDVLADQTGPGEVVVLPWSAYRAPVWNGGRPVLDPLPRLLTKDSVVSDDLLVSGRPVPGEDPHAARVGAALAAPTPEARARALAALGVQWTVTERDAGPAPAVAGTVVHVGPSLSVVRLAFDASPTSPGTGDRIALAAAWVAFVVLGLAGLLAVLRSGGSMVRRRRARAATVRAGGEEGHIG